MPMMAIIARRPFLSFSSSLAVALITQRNEGFSRRYHDDHHYQISVRPRCQKPESLTAEYSATPEGWSLASTVAAEGQKVW